MGKRTGRPRGAPLGNTNRLIHGERSAIALARRRLAAAEMEDARQTSDILLLLTRLHRLETLLAQASGN
jgi:hypothetical protein